MSYSSEDLETFRKNSLGLDDTFKFTCKQCGNCCRNRDDPILITGVDIFYIAKELGIRPIEVIENYTDSHIGSDSRTPVFTLAERLDGSCRLLRKGKCTVQKNKPITCAIYPLGRMNIFGSDEYTYFTQPIVCQGKIDGEEHTVREWIESFNIPQKDAEGIAWFQLFTKVSKEIRDAEKNKDKEWVRRSVMMALQNLYIGYDTSKSLLEQIQYYLRCMDIPGGQTE